MAPLGRVLLAVVESNLSSLHHVHQSSWRGHQQVAASLQVSDLLTNVRSTVHHTGAHSGPISKLQRATERLTVCLCGCLGSFRVPVHVSACMYTFLASSYICSASSLVGASTSEMGYCLRRPYLPFSCNTTTYQ